MRRPGHSPSKLDAPPLPTTQAGFTLVEVMLAALLLSVGVGAFLGTAVLTIRMVVRGRQLTRTAQAASGQLESLRATAASPPAYCAGLSDGSDSSADGTVRRWWVLPVAGRSEILVAVSAPVPGGWLTDSMTTSLRCP